MEDNRKRQVNDAKIAMFEDEISSDIVFKNLIDSGMDKADAASIVKEALKERRDDLFEKNQMSQTEEDKEKVGMGGAFGTAAFTAFLGISSIIWYSILIIIAGGFGYYGSQKKPIAGIVGSISLLIFMGFTYDFYFRDRTSFIKIEIVIPLLLAAIPAYLLYFGISKLFYKNK